ncbi:MAG: class IV adenylate cyclase [Patescibacteria group bacterium]|nr:class IV adenylate cyclase [Patescibacteria group bacterium]
MNEYEVKFLDIDVAEMEKKLIDIGAKKVGEYPYQSCSFDFPGFTLDKQAAWVRLRDEGDRVMLAYKQRLGVKSSKGDDDGMKEVEVQVSDFNKTKEFLLSIGMVVKFEQEKKRVRWTKDNVEFDFDTWPKLNTYMEIEAKSEEELWKAVDMLGLSKENAKRCSATQVYEMNGIRDKDFIKMTFGEFIKR